MNAIASALCGLATQAQRTSVELAVSNKLGKTVKLEDLVQEKKSLQPLCPTRVHGKPEKRLRQLDLSWWVV